MAVMLADMKVYKVVELVVMKVVLMDDSLVVLMVLLMV